MLGDSFERDPVQFAETLGDIVLHGVTRRP
jgi:hypothetical protein